MILETFIVAEEKHAIYACKSSKIFRGRRVSEDNSKKLSVNHAKKAGAAPEHRAGRQPSR
jgi:hypothetical protein